MRLTKVSERAVQCRWCASKGDRERRFDWYTNAEEDSPIGRNGRRFVLVERVTNTWHRHHYNGDPIPPQYVGDRFATDPAPTPETPAMPANVEGLADAVVNALRPRLGDLLDRPALDRRIREQGNAIMRTIADQLSADMGKKIAELRVPQRIELVRQDGITVDAGIQHREFPRLVRYLATRRVNVLMVGPAGSGKTVAAEQAAKALGIPFYPKSLGPSTREHEFAGFHGPNGVVHGILREPFTRGGLLLLDEGDRANPAVMTILNAALANRYFSFPDGVVERHPDFVCAMAANTWGRGADRQYVGANALDASTLNRFVQIPWDYDEDLETAIGMGFAEQAKDAHTRTAILTWITRVQKIRAAVFAQRLQIVVSPRAVIYGATLILAGDTPAMAEDATIWASVKSDDRAKVLANV